MAGDWIKMRADLFTHPKVVRISSALKADNLRTVGGLMSAWCLFDAHSIDGRLEGYTPATLDDHLRWPGFASAMVAVGWLIVDPQALELPRFDTHNGESAKRRAQDTERKRESRKLSASKPDKTRTREEKRREEAIELPTHAERTISSAERDEARAGVETRSEGPTPALTAAADTIRAAGCPDVAATNAHLVAALHDGIAVPELSDLAKLHPGKGIAYLCKKARGVRADAAANSGVSPAAIGSTRNVEGPSPRKSPEREALDRVEALAAQERQFLELGLASH